MAKVDEDVKAGQGLLRTLGLQEAIHSVADGVGSVSLDIRSDACCPHKLLQGMGGSHGIMCVVLYAQDITHELLQSMGLQMSASLLEKLHCVHKA